MCLEKDTMNLQDAMPVACDKSPNHWLPINSSPLISHPKHYFCNEEQSFKITISSQLNKTLRKAP